MSLKPPLTGPTVGSHAAHSRLTAACYRVYEFWRSVSARGLDDGEREVLAAVLSPAGCALFATMSRNDQRHCLTVYQVLHDERGCQDTELLAAALLHDVGKGAGRVPLWVRPPVVLLRAFAPGTLRWVGASPRPSWRRPFYNCLHHSTIGADLAASAGLSERTVLLIRTHHLPDGPAAALHVVDAVV